MSSVFRSGNIIYLTTDDGQQFYYDSASHPLGSGAMGTVYRGVDRHGRPVAIKRVKDRYSANPNIRRRARTEASLMFSHYNLVEMLGYCEVSPNNGPIFIISRYVQGQTIDKFIEEHRHTFEKPIEKVCELTFPIFDALAYLHNQNIIHSDIKPSNIMIEAGHNVRLMDLGIAQAYDAGASSESGGLMGTPRYAAPEQFSNSTSTQAQLDARTDIYELGITLYELLTGRNPFDGKTVDELRKQHSLLELPAEEGLPRPVLEVLKKATHPVSQYRYGNVTEFKCALQNAVYNSKPRISRFVVWVVIGLLAIVGLIISLILIDKV